MSINLNTQIFDIGIGLLLFSSLACSLACMRLWCYIKHFVHFKCLQACCIVFWVHSCFNFSVFVFVISSVCVWVCLLCCSAFGSNMRTDSLVLWHWKVSRLQRFKFECFWPAKYYMALCYGYCYCYCYCGCSFCCVRMWCTCKIALLTVHCFHAISV